MTLFPVGDTDQDYHFNIKKYGHHAVLVDINNSSLHKIYIHLNNVSLQVTKTSFYSAGLEVEVTESKSNHLSMNIQDCRFQETPDGSSLEITGLGCITMGENIYGSRNDICDEYAVIIKNTEFIGNSYGAVSCHSSVISLVNVTMKNNQAGFIFSDQCTMNISSSRFINNSHNNDIPSITNSILNIFDQELCTTRRMLYSD